MKTDGEASSLQIPVICSEFDPTQPSEAWLTRIALAASVYLEADPRRLGAQHMREAMALAEQALKCIEQSNALGAATCALGALQAAWRAELSEGAVMVAGGVKAYRKAEAANAEKTKTALEEKTKWQTQADDIWKRHPSHTAVAVAKLIDPKRFGYIRKMIRNPVK